jgi:hypothetical protein
MQFDKPKVTIDLEEYQFLKEQALKLETSDWYTVARMIMFAFSVYNRSAGDINRYLSDNGIRCVVHSEHSTRLPSFEDISITFNPKDSK